jgi:hypothetical protein
MSAPELNWQRSFVLLIYELLSPAVLGAMIYELLKREELRELVMKPADVFGKAAFWSRILVVVLFCMSWVYLRGFKGRREALGVKYKVAFCVIDLVSPLAFAVAFAFAGDNDFPLITSICIMIIAVFYLVAQVMRDASHRSGAGISCAALAIIVMGLHTEIGDLAMWGRWTEPAALGFVAVLYVIFLVNRHR